MCCHQVGTSRRTTGHRSPRAGQRQWRWPRRRPSASARVRRGGLTSRRCRRTRPRRRPPSPRAWMRRTGRRRPRAASRVPHSRVRRAGAAPAGPTPASGRWWRRRAGTGARAGRRCTRTAASRSRRSAPGSATGCDAACSWMTRVVIRSARSAERGVVEHVSGREQRLDGVHVGVHAAIGVERRPRLVPLLDDHPELVVPEVVEQHGQSLVEQLAGARSVGGGGTGRGEYDERVLVRRLVGRRRDRRDRPAPTSRR